MLLPHRAVSHLSYVVTDIEKAAHHWSRVLGAGPFFLIERMVFDEVTHFGQPCTFDHSAAFGQWGPIAIELQQIYASGPESLTARLIPGAAPVINHVAYISPAPEEDSAALSEAGFELFLHARFGPVEVRFHDTHEALGHAVEIHRECEFLDEFFGKVEEAARHWDGRQLVRLWK